MSRTIVFEEPACLYVPPSMSNQQVKVSRGAGVSQFLECAISGEKSTNMSHIMEPNEPRDVERAI